MMPKEVSLNFGHESRKRGRGFEIKRSRTKHYNLKFHRSLLASEIKHANKIKHIAAN